MRLLNGLLLFLATMLTAGGYGATFLLSLHFKSLGGSEIDTGLALAGAMFGTLVGVPLVGWFAPRLGSARMAMAAALCVAAGFEMFAVLTRVSSLIVVPGFFVGLGWGAFYLAAPMALAERTSDADRGFWFSRFGAFQMAGVGGSPILATYATNLLHMPIRDVFFTVGALCVAAAALLEVFYRLAPSSQTQLRHRWVRDIGDISRSPAIYPILMVALGACVLSGMMTFQTSLVQSTRATASSFFAIYALTVVFSRWLLAPMVNKIHPEIATKVLLVTMVTGVTLMFAIPINVLFQAASALLLGIGYGLVYPVIQTQVVNDSSVARRHAALTWFVVSYFVGIFGFPIVGGWILVHFGKSGLLTLIAACGILELILAMLRYRINIRTMLPQT